MYFLYADGSCRPNRGVGGWAFVIKRDDEPEFEVSLSGNNPSSTNNRMELTAALEGMKHFGRCLAATAAELTICLDSKYVLGGMESWSVDWIKQGWKKKNGKPVLNDDLWKEIVAELDYLRRELNSVKFEHTHGHSGHEWNSKCDRLAFKETKKCTKYSPDMA